MHDGYILINYERVGLILNCERSAVTENGCIQLASTNYLNNVGQSSTAP